MVDTPPVVAFPRPSKAEQVKTFIGDLARPFALYAIAISTAWAIFRLADPATIAAAGGVLALLYGAKAYEVQQQAKASATVEVAKAQAPAAAVAS